MSEVSIITAIFVGILVGWIAEQITRREDGLLLVVGFAGAFLAGFIASALGVGYAGFWGSLAVSAVGAVLLLAIVGLFQKQRAL